MRSRSTQVQVLPNDLTVSPVTLSRHIDPRPDHSQSGYNNLKHCALNNFVVFNFWSVGLELFDRQSFHKLRPLFN